LTGKRTIAFHRKKEEGLMSLIDFCILLAVAGVCGALGQAISGYSRGGCLVSIAIGFIGALLGIWIARQWSYRKYSF
jgi:uncharacterized membrane protein YeaQ/YmgE (transglycosylase-associated protein family)